MLLQTVLKAAHIEPRQCAAVLGVSPKVFEEWASGQRPVPPSYASTLSDVLGVPADEILLGRRRDRTGEGDVVPAIWFKLRHERLTDADRECILLIRHLGHLANELEEVTRKQLVGWRWLFTEVRDRINFQAPPREQGRQAARLFRSQRGLDSGKRGIGDMLRGNLRSTGVLAIESPLPDSKMEGCCFFVGSLLNERPCIFANSHHSTWFRRNVVLAHELAHAIFEGKNVGVSVDFVDETSESDLPEERAQAFAEELLIPADVLQHLAQSRGLRLSQLTASDLAWLVSETQVEQRFLVKGLLDAGMISVELADPYRQLPTSDLLKTLSEHALSAEEFIQKAGPEAQHWVGKRGTTVPSRGLRLPASYVAAVLSAYQDVEISLGRAAELLMLDEEDFAGRFPESVAQVEGN